MRARATTVTAATAVTGRRFRAARKRNNVNDKRVNLLERVTCTTITVWQYV